MTIPVFVVNSHEAKFDKLIASIEKLLATMSASGGAGAPGSPGGMSDLEKAIAAGAVAEAARRAANAVLDGVAEPAVHPAAPNGNAPIQPAPYVPPQLIPNNPYVPPAPLNPLIPNPNFGPDGRPLPFVPPPGPIPPVPQPPQNPNPQPVPDPDDPGSSPGSASPNEAKVWSQLTQKEKNLTIAMLKKPMGWGMMTTAQQQSWRKQQYYKVQSAALAKEKKDNETAAQEKAKLAIKLQEENLARAKKSLPPIVPPKEPANWSTMTIKQKDIWRDQVYQKQKIKHAADLKKALDLINAESALPTPTPLPITPVPEITPDPTTPDPVIEPDPVKPDNAPHDWNRYNAAQKKHWLAEHKHAPITVPVITQDVKVFDPGQTSQEMANSNCSIIGNYTVAFEHNLKKPMGYADAILATDDNLIGSNNTVIPANSPAAAERAALLNMSPKEKMDLANSTIAMPNYCYMNSLANSYSCGYNVPQAKQIATAAMNNTALPQFIGESTVAIPLSEITATSDLRAALYNDTINASQYAALEKQRQIDDANEIANIPTGITSTTDIYAMVRSNQLTPAQYTYLVAQRKATKVVTTDPTNPTSIPSNAGN